MSTWGKPPTKGKIHRCTRCREPLYFVSHRKPKMKDHEATALHERMRAHFKASPTCSGAHQKCINATACSCDPPCAVTRDDGIHCALCNGQVEWVASRPPTKLWRGWPLQPAMGSLGAEAIS